MDRRMTVKLPKETIRIVRKLKVSEQSKDGKPVTFTFFLNDLVMTGIKAKSDPLSRV